MEEKLHILYLASWYPNRKDPTLGIFVKRHAEAAALIHKVTLLHAIQDTDMLEGEFRLEKSEQGSFRQAIVYYGPSRSRIGILRKLKNFRLRNRYYRFGLGKVLEWSGRFDLIHLHVPWPLGMLAKNFSLNLGIPYVVTEHWTGYQPEDGRYKGWLVKKVTTNATAGAAAVVTVSDYLKDSMQAKGVPGNYRTIPNVVNDELFKPAIEEIAEKHFIHVSSLDDQQKNVSGIIRAFAQLRKTHPEVRLVIVGQGADEQKLKKLANEMGLGGRSVFFVGKKLEEELAKEFQQARALVLNSRYETQGVVLLEALSAGVPVIAPAIGGIDPEIANGRGILFDPENEDALYNAMLTLIEKSGQFDSQAIRQYAVSKYSYPVVAKQLNALYREILRK